MSAAPVSRSSALPETTLPGRRAPERSEPGQAFTLPQEPAFRGPQRYMFHCHNLEHEDGMMMRNVTVV